MSNIIDKIQLSGVTYDIGGSGSVSTAITSGDTNAVAGGAVYDKFDEVEEVTARALNGLSEADEVAARALIDLNTNKQDKLTAGENIVISGNVISAEGGGKPIEGGRGISVTTGATADTVSFNLPISGGSGTYSIIEGEGTRAANNYEHASGRYNVSSSASTTFGHSGNTLFSVGNGTSSSNKHNALEIRQNGDIYVQSGSSTVKLQDKLGSPTVELTQAQYDALQTKDPNTYYIITDASPINMSLYWTSAETQSAITESISGKVDTSTYTAYTASTNTALNNKVNNSTYTAYTASTQVTLNNKQNTLVAGDNITISGNVISASGGAASSAITSGDTNPVQGGVLYDKFDEIEQVTARALNQLAEANEVVARALNDLNDRITAIENQLNNS